KAGTLKTRLYGEHHLITLYFCWLQLYLAQERVKLWPNKNTPMFALGIATVILLQRIITKKGE
ncbi:hypothetical protein, partial [Capnocytophaga canimorsus]|uniref:hypothetical protein n=1 Tax=Capnocytophaga canimorsus TaxID=28188 RepID=UPI0037DD24B2